MLKTSLRRIIVDEEALKCPEDNVPMALLGLLDKKTSRERWLCSQCNKIYLGEKIEKKHKQEDEKEKN